MTLAGVALSRDPAPGEERPGPAEPAAPATMAGAGRAAPGRDGARPSAPVGASVQRRGELRRRGEPVGRELLQRGEHGVLDLVGHARSRCRRCGRRLVGHHLGDDRLGRAAGERRIADEHLVGHAAERVDVGARRDLPLAHRLLGRHVVRRAERHAGLGHPRCRRRWRRPARCRSRRPAPEPSWSRMFSGLMSRWITPCRWA